MSIKCKYSDIKDIYDWCERYADAEARELIGTQPSMYLIAHFAPSGANWCYQLGLVHYKGNYYQAVTVFGEVKAVRPAYVPSYDAETLNNRRY